MVAFLSGSKMKQKSEVWYTLGPEDISMVVALVIQERPPKREGEIQRGQGKEKTFVFILSFP